MIKLKETNLDGVKEMAKSLLYTDVHKTEYDNVKKGLIIIANDYKLTPLEKETIILWNEAEDVIYIDTRNPNLIKRLNNAKKKHPTEFKVEPPDKYGNVCAIVSKDVLRISLHAPMTEEKRERLSTQAKEWQEKNGV